MVETARKDETAGEHEEPKMKAEVFLPEDYRPAEDEPFMNARQLEYFRRKLLAWKADLLDDSKHTIEGLQDSSRNIPDIADRASEETDRALELRTRDRQRKLVAKIDSALRRIEEGEYGYCEETGDPISLKRLDARPIATLSLEAQDARAEGRVPAPRIRRGGQRERVVGHPQDVDPFEHGLGDRVPPGVRRLGPQLRQRLQVLPCLGRGREP